MEILSCLEEISTLIVSTKTAESLGLKDKPFSFISFGTSKCYVNVKIIRNIEEDKVFVSQDILNKLHIPQYVDYQVKINKNEIVLGPSIGILVYKKDEMFTESKLKKLLSYGNKYNKLKGALIVFAFDKIDIKMKMIEGYCYNCKAEVWERGIFPFPLGVYRRIGLNSEEKNILLNIIGDNFFNNYYFNKWEMYQWLLKITKINEYLPLTVLFKDKEDIFKMLEKYNEVFIKPISGLQGKGIFKVNKKGNKFTIKYRKNNKNYEVEKEDINSFINENFKKERYIVQQPIDLLKYDDKIVDFRVVMQKNIKGTWNLSLIVVRAGASGSVVSNISNGGEAFKIDEFLSNILKLPQRDVLSLKASIKELSLCVCNALDNFGLNLGTLGLDLAIDKEWKLWLIEINNRDPDPTIALDIKNKVIYNKIKCNTLFYAKYLSGFGK